MADVKIYLVKLESYTGEDTQLLTVELAPDGWNTEEKPFMWAVVGIGDHGAFMLDYGYWDLEEAKAAWPNAVVPEEEASHA